MLNAPLSTRILKLLEKAADAFIKNTNPFDVEWMTQYDVTLEECVDLSELIGRVLDDYVYNQKAKEGGDTS